MAATDLERLVVTLEAQSSKLDKTIKASADLVDKQLSRIEQRTSQMSDRVTGFFAKTSSGVSRAITLLGGTLATRAFFSFFDKVTAAAQTLQNLSKITGISMETLQAWRISAQDAGVSSDDLNTAVGMFSRNFGQAQLGVGKLKFVFDALKISTKQGLQPAMMQFAGALQGIRDPAQRAAVAAVGFGRGWQAVAPFFLQGSEAIDAQTESLKGSGEILDDVTNNKLVALGNKWTVVKRELETLATKALSDGANEFERMNGTVTSEKFQSGLANIGKLMSGIAVAVADIASHPGVLGALVGAAAGGRIAGLPGAAVGAIGGGLLAQNAADGTLTDADAYAKEHAATVENLNRQIASTKALLASGSGFWGSLSPGEVDAETKHLRDLEAQLKKIQDAGVKTAPIAKKSATVPETKLPPDLLGPHPSPDQLAARAQAIKDALARIATMEAQADSEEIAAQDKLNVQLLEGTSGYYDAVMKMIADELAAKLTSISAEQAAQITALGKLKGISKAQHDAAVADIKATSEAKIAAAKADAKAAGDAAGPSGINRAAMIAADQQIQQTKDQIALIGLQAGAAAKLAYEQKLIADYKAKGLEITQAEIEADPVLAAEAEKVAAAASKAFGDNQQKQNAIDLTNTFRDGLEAVGVAGIDGFKSMKAAAASFLDTLAQTIIKLYVMQPLLNSILGQPGTSGGGILGGTLKDIFGFAGGGVFVPGSGPRSLKRFASGGVSTSAAIFGEAGPEAAVPLPDGRRIPVDLRLPSMPQVSGAQSVSFKSDFTFHITGTTDKELLKQMSAVTRVALDQYDKTLPTKVARLRDNPRLRSLG